MQGFIINIRKAKNEDVIVTVLSKSSIESYWRFFGARHSILQVGNFIDFEIEQDRSNFMPKMRRLSHISFPWIFSANHLLIWQNFIKLFEPHLKEATQLDSFYFDLLLALAKKWDRQNPKRLAVEAYVKLLAHEGRLYDNGFCYICEEVLGDKVGLMRAYIPAHPHCIYANALDKNSVFELFNTKSTIKLEDFIIDEFYNILLKGF
ncbi:MAG: recombination protein RecO [Epsilonproteobacteria bacterium]|nr:recombination protein RecO [Campylobacterota bacterium]